MPTTQVNFHILENANHIQALHYACQQIEKIFQPTLSLFVQTENADQAKRLDTLLWTFREDSFLPHEIYQANNSKPAPIQIGYQDNAPEKSRLLINLSKQLPHFEADNGTIIEIVFSDPTMQQLARERFKQYRDLGFTMTTNKLKLT